MALLPIRLFPDSILRKPAEKVARFDQKLAALILSMEETMRSQRAGIGIAAPQVGVGLRLALVDVSARMKGAKRLVLVNPRIMDVKQEKISREGCMSLPEYTGNLKRYDWVRLVWQDASGKTLEGDFSGIEAVCIQHEVDHLDGKLFLDHISFLNRDLIPRHFSDRHSHPRRH